MQHDKPDTNDGCLKDLEILVIDDQESNLLLLERILKREGYTRVTTTRDPTKVPQMFARAVPDLVLLDLHMPGMDGFELMERLGPMTGSGTRVPFLVLTADTTPAAKRNALSMGARDFLTKPVDPTEVGLRVRNLLEVHYLQRQLEHQNDELEKRVRERTGDLEQARMEMLQRLAVAAEYRDDDTQDHAWRIGRTAGLLARGLGLSTADVRLIRLAAPLHDIGKIGIPDAILLKPGKLTAEEFELMKRHTTIGADVLAGSRAPLLRLATVIALTHHERWDGQGYPEGLAGNAIPQAGRIVAVADVFDALTHKRPYKEAWPVEDAVREVVCQAGRQFDPEVVKVFEGLEHRTLLAGSSSGSGHTNGRGRRLTAHISRARPGIEASV